MSWRTVPEGSSTHEDAVLVESDGFKACIVYSDLHFKHEATRRDHRLSLFEVKGFEVVHQQTPTLVILTPKVRVLLPDVSKAFAEAVLIRVARYLPGSPSVEVTEQQLIDHPTRYHLQLVRVRGHHVNQFEGQRFANAWLSVPRELGRASGGDVEIEGLFLSDPAKHATWNGFRGYGHMGMSGAELLAYSYTPV